MNTPPLFKDIYALNVNLLQAVVRFPKDFKYSLGERIKNSALELLGQLQRNLQSKKVVSTNDIHEMIVLTEHIRILLRLGHDTKCISIKTFTTLNTLIEKIIQQLHGWKNAQARKFKNSVGG